MAKLSTHVLDTANGTPVQPNAIPQAVANQPAAICNAAYEKPQATK